VRPSRLAATAVLALALGGACGSCGESAPDAGADANSTEASRRDVGAPTGPDAGADESVDAPFDPGALGCMRICMMVAELQCPTKTDCLTPCLTQLNGDCKNATRRLVDCAMAQPTSAFHCDANGIGMISNSVCLDEMAAVQTCNRSGVDQDAGSGD